MPISPQGGGLYNFVVATDVLGGQWNTPLAPDMEGHLQDLIWKALPYSLPDGANPLLNLGTNDGGVTIFVQFTQDIPEADQPVLSEQVLHASDYFIVTTDGGQTDKGNPAKISVPAGPGSSTTVTLKRKNGDGTDSDGDGEAVNINPASTLLPISTLSGNFDENGEFEFVIGASQQRGAVAMEVQAGSLPSRTVEASWT
jgi:hypothetical protein